jgi:hypothetical protein
MSNISRFVFFAALLVFSATAPTLIAQTSSSGIEQQLRAQYPITLVGNNGVVTKAGSILVVQQDGITALPTPGEWPCNSFKSNGRISQAKMCEFNYAQAKHKTRLLQVGEKVYLVAIQAKPTEIVFKVQSIADEANDAPFKAAVSFEFPKGYLDSIKVKDVQDKVSQVFVPDTSVANKAPDPLPAAKVPTEAHPNPASLALPAVFISSKSSADRIQLNADNSFSLTEAGQSYHGTFAVSGNNLQLSLTETGTQTNGTLQGSQLTDSSGQVWKLGDPATKPSVAQNVLQNQDVIELAKAGFDDATILTTIGNSKCQFDTSTNALIKLKQSKVSAAVIKAMVSAPK